MKQSTGTHVLTKGGLIMLLAASLVACGGGGDSPAPVTPTPPAVTEAVPASASSSVQGLLDYLQALAKAASDALEPVSLAGFSPATSETDEPRPIP